MKTTREAVDEYRALAESYEAADFPTEATHLVRKAAALCAKLDRHGS